MVLVYVSTGGDGGCGREEDIAVQRIFHRNHVSRRMSF